MVDDESKASHMTGRVLPFSPRGVAGTVPSAASEQSDGGFFGLVVGSARTGWENARRLVTELHTAQQTLLDAGIAQGSILPLEAQTKVVDNELRRLELFERLEAFHRLCQGPPDPELAEVGAALIREYEAFAVEIGEAAVDPDS